MKDNEMKDINNIQALSDEELEDVTGGGIREIVAGVTLAAMTVTGAPVSAFGLARAIAEDPEALIEEAPQEALYDARYDGIESAP